jgi:hypothetical protein
MPLRVARQQRQRGEAASHAELRDRFEAETKAVRIRRKRVDPGRAARPQSRYFEPTETRRWEPFMAIAAEAQPGEVDAEAERDSAGQSGGEELSDRGVAGGDDGRVAFSQRCMRGAASSDAAASRAVPRRRWIRRSAERVVVG